MSGALAEARALGFLGPGPLDAHIASAARFLAAIEAVQATGPGLDLGSGGGVPGLVLAAWLEDWSWMLLDAHRRRTSFLARAVADLGWAGRVQVVRGRAEEVAHRLDCRGRFGVVTARGFGPPPATAEAAVAFLVPGGHVLVSEPPGGGGRNRWPTEPLATLGLRHARVQVEGVMALTGGGSCPADIPRPTARQRSKPLWVPTRFT